MPVVFVRRLGLHTMCYVVIMWKYDVIRKPEVHTVSRCHQRRTDLRPRGNRDKNWWSSAVSFVNYASGQKDIFITIYRKSNRRAMNLYEWVTGQCVVVYSVWHWVFHQFTNISTCELEMICECCNNICIVYMQIQIKNQKIKTNQVTKTTCSTNKCKL